MRILITGAKGQLGTALQQVLADDDLILKDLPDFDLSNSACEDQIVSARPEVILHAGADKNGDAAEREPDRAKAVNGRGTTHVARAAQTLEAKMIYFSTDYVFDGEKNTPYLEEDPPRPLNQYGLSKYEGEQAAL